MLPPPPHYERFQSFLLQGDIGFFPFTQVVALHEDEALPGVALPSAVAGIPAFENMRMTTIGIGDTVYLLRHWQGLGIVIDQTSELMKRKDDSRVVVAPLVPASASGLDWALAAAGQYAGVLALPESAASSIAAGFPEADWPNMVTAARSVTTVSRSLAEAGRMMTLSTHLRNSIDV